MHDMTARTTGLQWSTLLFLAVTSVSGVAPAQQGQQPAGGALVEGTLPLMEAGSTVTWRHGRLGNQEESLFARLGYAHFSVVTQRPLSNEADGGTGVVDIFGVPSYAGSSLTDGQMQTYAGAYGYSLDTNPVSGSGRWQGHVVGIDISEGETRGNQILGDAAIVLANFAEPHIDVQLSGLLDLVTGSGHPDIRWKDIPVDQGAFGWTDDGGTLQGRFFGSEHEGVGGRFLDGSILGAFGAIRLSDAPRPASDALTVARILFQSSEALGSFAAGFDVGVRFRPGGASTSRLRLDYSVRSGPPAFDGVADLSTVRLDDSRAYVYRDSSRRSDTLEYLDTASAAFGLDNQSRVYSGGLAASANPPPGGATWVGVVAAMDPLDPATRVRGDALVQIDDFTDPVAFVALTNLREEVTRRPRHDIYWNRIPVRRGAFHGKTAGGWIRGRFHGQTQDGVAGTFFRPALTGAFGASRTLEPKVQGEVDESIPADSPVATAFQVAGRVSGSAVRFDYLGFGPEGGSDVAFRLAERASWVAALDSSLPEYEWFAGTSPGSKDWLDMLLGGVLTPFAESLDGEISHTLGPLPDGNYGALRYDWTGSGITRLTVTAGFAFGTAQLSNPVSGAATWTGEVIGFDITDGETSRNQIGGIATLTIGDFADPTVDVAFTGLQDVQTRTAIADMTWSAVPLEDGGFRSVEQSGMIDGQMYGTDHSHVGGVFERAGIVGGFGARRGSAP